jgi:hypothetical protein
MFSIFLMMGCDETWQNAQEAAIEEVSADSSFTATRVATFPYEELSQAEIEGLYFMREEEKLARDTYIRFYKMFGLLNFKNISQSEQAHMDAILAILNKYDLGDPAQGNDIGVYTNSDLQKLFDDLQEMGGTDKISALKAGALIEETDILDIQHELDKTVDNQDIRFVYGNLIRGSGFHLKSFVTVLKLYGFDYEPVLLDQDTYELIIADE